MSPIDEGPLKLALESSTEGVLQQTLTTYRKRDGMLVVEKVTRKHNSNGDYIDSFASNPLCHIGDNNE